MRYFVIIFIMLLGAANLSALSFWTITNEDQYKSDIRQKLNLDYSMPDYSVIRSTSVRWASILPISSAMLIEAAGLPSKVDLAFRFLDGISESKPVNEMFSYICNYVTAREKLSN